MRGISRASAVLAVTLAVVAGTGDVPGVTALAQSPLLPAAPAETAPPLPHASSDASGAYVGDVLYVHAGEQRRAARTAASTGKAALYALSPRDASWTTVWTGSPVRGAVLVSDGEDIYRVGGRRGHGPPSSPPRPAAVGLDGRAVGRPDADAVGQDGPRRGDRRAPALGGRRMGALGRGRGSRCAPTPARRAGRGLARRRARRRSRRGPRDLDRGRDGIPASALPRGGRSRRRHLGGRRHDAPGTGARSVPAGPADPDAGAGAGPTGAPPWPERRVGHDLDRGEPVRKRHEPTVSSRRRGARLAGARLRHRAGTREPRAGRWTGSAAHRGGSRARPDPRGSRPGRGGLAPAERRHRRARGAGRARQATGLRWPATGAGPAFGGRRSVTARRASSRWSGRTRRTSRGGTRSGATANRAPWSGTASCSSPPSTARGAKRRSWRRSTPRPACCGGATPLPRASPSRSPTSWRRARPRRGSTPSTSTSCSRAATSAR